MLIRVNITDNFVIIIINLYRPTPVGHGAADDFIEGSQFRSRLCHLTMSFRFLKKASLNGRGHLYTCIYHKYILLTKLEVSVCRYNFPFDLWSNQGQLLLIIRIYQRRISICLTRCWKHFKSSEVVSNDWAEYKANRVNSNSLVSRKHVVMHDNGEFTKPRQRRRGQRRLNIEFNVLFTNLAVLLSHLFCLSLSKLNPEHNVNLN